MRYIEFGGLKGRGKPCLGAKNNLRTTCVNKGTYIALHKEETTKVVKQKRYVMEIRPNSGGAILTAVIHDRGRRMVFVLMLCSPCLLFRTFLNSVSSIHHKKLTVHVELVEAHAKLGTVGPLILQKGPPSAYHLSRKVFVNRITCTLKFESLAKNVISGFVVTETRDDWPLFLITKLPHPVNTFECISF